MKKIGNVARIRNATERRALEQAPRVPWPRLAKAVDEYTDWHTFALWVRATVEISNNVPRIVQSEIERHAPGAVDVGPAQIRQRRNGVRLASPAAPG